MRAKKELDEYKKKVGKDSEEFINKLIKAGVLTREYSDFGCKVIPDHRFNKLFERFEALLDHLGLEVNKWTKPSKEYWKVTEKKKGK